MNVPAAFSFLRNFTWFCAGFQACSVFLALWVKHIGWAALFLLALALFVSIARKCAREISRQERP